MLRGSSRTACASTVWQLRVPDAWRFRAPSVRKSGDGAQLGFHDLDRLSKCWLLAPRGRHPVDAPRVSGKDAWSRHTSPGLSGHARLRQPRVSSVKLNGQGQLQASPATESSIGVHVTGQLGDQERPLFGGNVGSAPGDPGVAECLEPFVPFGREQDEAPLSVPGDGNRFPGRRGQDVSSPFAKVRGRELKHVTFPCRLHGHYRRPARSKRQIGFAEQGAPRRCQCRTAALATSAAPDQRARFRPSDLPVPPATPQGRTAAVESRQGLSRHGPCPHAAPSPSQNATLITRTAPGRVRIPVAAWLGHAATARKRVALPGAERRRCVRDSRKKDEKERAANLVSRMRPAAPGEAEPVARPVVRGDPRTEQSPENVRGINPRHGTDRSHRAVAPWPLDIFVRLDITRAVELFALCLDTSGKAISRAQVRKQAFAKLADPHVRLNVRHLLPAVQAEAIAKGDGCGPRSPLLHHPRRSAARRVRQENACHEGTLGDLAVTTFRVLM